MPRISSPTLVGRAAELDRLAVSASAPPALVVVDGEAGVGKSRLVAALGSQPAMGARRHLSATCLDLREPLPLAPLAEALRGCKDLPLAGLSPLIGVIGTLLPELTEELPPAPPSSGDRGEDRHRVFRALVEVLAALGPAVLVIEDAHWADDATMDFFTVLTTAWPAQLSVVMTVRIHEAPDPTQRLLARRHPALNTERITLRALDRPATGELAASILSVDTVSDEFAAYLHDKTQGLPFAIEELVQLLRERHDVVREQHGWTRKPLDDIEVPAGVREFVLGRFAMLSEHGRRLIEAAAVFGVDADETALATVSGMDDEDVSWALAEGLRQGLLAEFEGRYRLRHDLARDAVIHNIAEPQRRRLHLRCATWYEACEPKPLAKLAHHYAAARQTAAFLRYASDAAAAAAESSDHRLAFDLLRRLLSMVGAQERPMIAARLAQAAVNAALAAAAVGTLRTVLAERAWPAAIEGELRWELASLLYHSGDGVAAAGEATAAFSLLVDCNPAPAARSALMLATPAWHRALTRDEHVMWLERAEALAPRLTDGGTLVSLQFDAVNNRRHMGEPVGEALIALPRTSSDPAERHEIGRGFLNLADACLDVGHDADAAAAIANGRAVAGANMRLVAALKALRLRLDFFSGAWGGLEQRLSSALASTQTTFGATFDMKLTLAQLQLAQGQVEEAFALASEAYATADDSALVQAVPTAAGGLARLLSFRGEHDRAAEVVASAAELLQAKDMLVWVAPVAVRLVRDLMGRGEHADAQAFVARLAAVRDLDAPAARAALDACVGLVAAATDPDRAARSFARAVTGWRAIPRPYEAALTLELWAEAVADDREAHARSALQEFEALGASWDAARARRILRSAGAVVATPGRRGRKGYGNELSPREREVADLIAAGCTNDEIAARLFLSPKTVARHVENAMRKTSTPSRAALAVVVSLADLEAASARDA